MFKYVIYSLFISLSLFADVDFSNPTSTPPGTTPPNLSDPGQYAINAQITTNSTGRYVYAVWQRFDGNFCVVQVAISSDYGVTISDPTSTPPNTTSPNLSNSSRDASLAQITTNSTGKYVYATWLRFCGSNDVVQVAISSDYGDTWESPTSTPSGISPNLSVGGKPAFCPQITTDATGQYVYATWLRFGGSHNIVQVAISSDYGVSWKDPTSTPAGTSPNLSVEGMPADNPYITTDATGQYVYAIWKRFNSSQYVIQVAISSDYGNTWENPTSTPTGTSPNLSVAGKPANNPYITTDATGQYVYAVWERFDGSYYIIQVAISSDYGDTWGNPTSTPVGTTTPNLSVSGKNAFYSRIATDATGRYVYAVWQRFDGFGDVIQVAISSDNGDTWTNPTSTPTGTSPNLSVSGFDACNARVVTNATGQYVYTVWQRYDGSKYIIQAAVSLDNGNTWGDPTSTPTGNSPNLSSPGQEAYLPQISTDDAGEYTYASWEIMDGSDFVVQATRGVRD
jgi:hypothetical protein